MFEGSFLGVGSFLLEQYDVCLIKAVSFFTRITVSSLLYVK